jgi:cell wall-associated NlpC family hydrolase
MALNGRALAATSIGVLFVWSGIKGWSVLATMGDLITGVKPNQPVANPLSSGTAGVASPSALSGIYQGPAISGGIASIAVQYQGHAYIFGAAPGRDGSRPWDCSSFVNWVVGVKGNRAIPGNAPGQYTGTTHGPPTGMWAAWSGMDTIKRSQVQAGDILLWAGHMGIAISNTQMISALNPRITTKITTIDAGVGRGPLVRCGRLR